MPCYFIHVYLSIYEDYTIGKKPYLTVFDIYSALRKGLEIQLSLLNATLYKKSNKDLKAQYKWGAFVKSSIFNLWCEKPTEAELLIEFLWPRVWEMEPGANNDQAGRGEGQEGKSPETTSTLMGFVSLFPLLQNVPLIFSSWFSWALKTPLEGKLEVRAICKG